MAAPSSTFLLLLLLSFFVSILLSHCSDFIYNGFNDSSLVQQGTTIIKPSGALRLTNKTNHIIGHAFYPHPIPFSNSSSFSTSFVLAIVSASSNRGGYGLAFTLSPSPQFTGGEDEHFLGILNSTTDGKQSNGVFAVEFDTVRGFREPAESFGNHVGINVNSMDSLVSQSAVYYPNGRSGSLELDLESGDPIQAWIDYDGFRKVLNVTIAPFRYSKPSKPLISYNLDLSLVLKDSVFAGFSAATGTKASSHYILGWSFRLNGIADPLDPSRLPMPPKTGVSSSSKPPIKALIAVLSSVILFLLLLFVSIMIYRRRKHMEPVEDWELDSPHRFKYKELYKATKGFKESELLGVGGFGAVYKGVLPSTGVAVAVKRITANNPLQGMREFAAEIESLGRLRHKHLVNLQGWCKKKNDLLLVYDYVPNGSLESLLLHPRNGFVLSWEERFNIVKGIAAGLLYLHEEWEKVVIHRDVKSSNVLIDADMNGRLGDFGMARLCDHGKTSHATSVVGTIGYLAPELTRTGKASTGSDVFAYGVVLLEVACGRGPVVDDPGDGPLIITDWVIKNLQRGGLLEVVDRKLASGFVVEEMELVLGLGIRCSDPRPEARPTMRQITRYLNREERPPVFDGSTSSSTGVREESSTIIPDSISREMFSSSYKSSSIGHMSASSFGSGR